jgi:DNA-binding phage protein
VTTTRHRTREAAHVSEEVLKKHVGSSFESFLEENGIKDEVELRAQKEILAEQIREAMDRKGVTFSALASSMGTSRTVVYRLLDPNDTGVTLETLSRVARALGLGLKVSLARAPSTTRASLRKTA